MKGLFAEFMKSSMRVPGGFKEAKLSKTVDREMQEKLQEEDCRGFHGS